jgi:hypothetical protein
MTINDVSFLELCPEQLAAITGGAAPSRTQFDQIREQAAQYCPATAEKYASLNPAKLTRSKATRMGNECLAEMGPMSAMLARPRIESAIDAAWPRK